MLQYFKDRLRRFIRSCVSQELGKVEKSIEKAEKNVEKTARSIEKVDKSIGNLSRRTGKWCNEIHTHIDFTYRDIMIVLEKQLNFIGKHDLVLKTQYPCAYNSLDYTNPKGTADDNTRYPRFIKKCEAYFGQPRDLSFLDLGCSGGGMVLDAIIRGHFAIGLEGSDYSLLWQRAEWRLLRENLFTCDITKPFDVQEEESGKTKHFDVITAWEVLEHIEEDDLPQLFENISNHLSDNGIFVGSIACRDSIDKKTGINWHRTVHQPEWWKERIPQWGFEEIDEGFETEDMARGWFNSEIYYKTTVYLEEPSFFVVLKKCTTDEQMDP